MIHLIRESAPIWFQVDSSDDVELLGVARIELDSAAGSIEADLRIRQFFSEIAVQEQVPGTKYPTTCHERHIQSDQHFCIGMNAGRDIVSLDHAIVWWGLLARFLRLQRVAERTRRWPPQQEMAHGDAGPHQMAAFAAAKTLGIEDQYLRMLEGEQTWFGSDNLKIGKRGRLENGWLPCPAGCTKIGKRISRADCKRKDPVVALLREERLRRRKMDQFYALWRAVGEKCCGTMLRCPLREIPEIGLPSAMSRQSKAVG